MEDAMNVAHILSVKGRDVITTQPHRTLSEASFLLADRGVGAVVVTGADGQVLGILSERDIVRAVAQAGATALGDAVTRHMTTRVVTASIEMSIDRLMEEMTQGRFRHVPVIENGRLAGLVSIGDVVKWHVEAIETEHRALREYIATA
jgi:CBS domain-containing protein